jgi:hypothetical protein
MELRETIESINYKLERDYGKHDDGRVNFRVVWSNDQTEKRWTKFNDKGIELIHAEVRELPKYKQWCPNRWVLERLVPVDPLSDLVERVSYESAWVFQDRNQNYLPPFFEGCVHVIDSMRMAIGRSGYARYKDPDVDPEYRAAMLQKVQDDLFGNETDVGDHLTYGTGVVVPGDGNQRVIDLDKATVISSDTSKLVH